MHSMMYKKNTAVTIFFLQPNASISQVNRFRRCKPTFQIGFKFKADLAKMGLSMTHLNRFTPQIRLELCHGNGAIIKGVMCISEWC